MVVNKSAKNSLAIVQRAAEFSEGGFTIEAAKCYDGYVRVWTNKANTGAFIVTVLVYVVE